MTITRFLHRPLRQRRLAGGLGLRAAKRTGGWSRSLVLLALVPLGLGLGLGIDYWSAYPPDHPARFIGRDSCISCHPAQVAAFTHSHHDLAMDLATDETVLGDFNDVIFEHHGIRSRMFRRDKRFMIHTEGPDGELADFEVKYVFGVEPLQQYMVEFDRTPTTPPTAIARLQVLRISWDTHKRQWFHLDPPDVTEKLAPDDDLHWTGIAQRWNTMCAECHSTNLRRNYDPLALTYATTFSEIDVSCEACHGPASTHVELAQAKSLFWDRNLGYALAELKSPDSTRQLETCAPCHSRRGIIAEGFQPGDEYCDFFDLSRLESSLYFDDGQSLDEVYIHGSFLQSKMYHKGIRCTDCHDPHSLQLKADGNQVCTSCHQHPAGKYDTPSHHKHPPGQPGSQCVDCHMPETTYMMVDPRRDHSLRIPRPDLSVALGTPNACTGCHLEPERIAIEKRGALGEYSQWLAARAAGDEEVQAEIRRVDQWCDQACDQWYGSERRRESHFAEALVAARTGAADADRRLREIARSTAVVPAIARATALDELAMLELPEQLPNRIEAGKESLDDPSPLVRAAAVRALAAEMARPGGVNRLLALVAPRLDDSSRLVRSAAARVIAASGGLSLLDPSSAQRFRWVLEEIQLGLRAVADRGGAHLDWAQLCEQTGRLEEAMQSYQIAIKVEPQTVGARSNLASLLEQVLESQAAAGRLTPAQQQAAREQITQLRRDELPLLQRDAHLLPTNAMIQYRLGLAYYLDGQWEKALQALQRANELETNTDFATALRLLQEKMSEQANPSAVP